MARRPLKQTLRGLAWVAAMVPLPLAGQERPTGLEIGALPAINFDADEGFGYGALAELYQYGDGTLEPYLWSVRPTIFLTTEGRKDFTLFFDAPHLLPDGWRLDAFLGSEEQIATPYYGLGNATLYDETLEAEGGPNPFFYRFGRTRRSATFNLQKSLGESSLRWLFGAGVVNTDITGVPEDDGTTLYVAQQTVDDNPQWSNYVRGGLVWDTRNRETGTQRGTWTEFLVQRVDEQFGADASYTRWTFTDRRYVSLTDRIVFAHRYLLQGVTDGVPAYDLFRVQTSFTQQEGLGGAKTVRGVLKNRFVGRGMVVWNAELRWRAAEFRLIGRPFHVVLSAFLDQGRVWEEALKFDELLTDLHRGFGGGVRIGMGENFIVALDIGRSDEAGMPMYIGLGYLY